MGKGSGRRPCQVDQEEEALRWELPFCGFGGNRREEILKRLEEIENERRQCSSSTAGQ